MVADSMLSLYRRKDGKSPYWWLKFVVPEPLHAQLGALKRVSTGHTDKVLARKEALRRVAEWCAPLLDPAPPTNVSPESKSEDRSLEPFLRPVLLTHELIDELCRARREATMWSKEDDANGVSFDGLEQVIEDKTGVEPVSDRGASQKHDNLRTAPCLPAWSRTPSLMNTSANGSPVCLASSSAGETVLILMTWPMKPSSLRPCWAIASVATTRRSSRLSETSPGPTYVPTRPSRATAVKRTGLLREGTFVSLARPSMICISRQTRLEPKTTTGTESRGVCLLRA
jgi:hypothetical protein